MKNEYAARELPYSKPIADAVVDDAAFRKWLLSHTKFVDQANIATPLHESMRARRSKTAKYWWRSHYQHRCPCDGCSGQESDILIIFESAKQSRFALHIEVKQPTDSFSEDGRQAAAYPIRAACWVVKPPVAVLPHEEADTMLLCSSNRLTEFGSHADKFGSVVTFESIRSAFPSVKLPVK